MGQQQLLLLVLGIVVVTIAVVSGINAFSEGKGKAEHDAATSEGVRIATDVQAWLARPAASGGGGSSTGTLRTVGFGHIGRNPADDAGTNDALYETASGCFELAPLVNGAATIFMHRRVNGACEHDPYALMLVWGVTHREMRWHYAG